MKNRKYTILFAVALVVSTVLLAFSIQNLINNFFYEKESYALKNVRGLNKLKSQTTGANIPLSKFSSYDQVHGTKLYDMASQLPSVSANQVVTPFDFKQLQIAAKNQVKESNKPTNSIWNIFAVLILTPCIARVVSNLTEDLFYKPIKETILTRYARPKNK